MYVARVLPSLNVGSAASLRQRFSSVYERLRTWRRSQTHYLGLFIGILTALGHWPEADNTAARRSHPGRVLNGVWLAVLVPFCTSVHLTSAYVHRHVAFTDALVSLLNACVHCVFVLIVATLRRRRARLLDARVALDAMLLGGSRLAERPTAILRHSKATAELCVVFYVAGASVYAVGAVCTIVVGFVTRSFGYSAWFPYDTTSSPLFELTSVAMHASMVIGFHLLLAVYSLILLLIVLAIGQFRLLNFNLQRLDQSRSTLSDDTPAPVPRTQEGNGTASAGDDLVTMESASTVADGPAPGGRLESLAADGEDEQRLEMCVRQHQSIMRFVNAIPPAFDPILLSHLNYSVAPSILTIAFLINAPLPGVLIFLICMPLFGCLVYTWLLCWLGEKISTESELVRDSVFGCDWVGSSARFRRAMGIIISMSNQPKVVRVAGFIPLSLPLFYAILRLTYSWCMSLIELRAKLANTGVQPL